MSKDLLTLQTGNTQGCPRPPSAQVRPGRAGECELMRTEGPYPQKCWLKGQTTLGGGRSGPASQLPACDLLLGPQAQTGIFHCWAWTSHQGPAGLGQGSLLALACPHPHPSCPTWKLTSSKKACLQLQSFFVFFRVLLQLRRAATDQFLSALGCVCGSERVV